MKLIQPTLLCAALAFAATGLAAAQTPAPKAKEKVKVASVDAATEAQLAAAHKELERAAKRVAELNRKLGHDGVADVRVFQRKGLRKPVIGVVLAPDAQGGVRVAGVTPDSGAAKAGLKAGDRITSIDGTQVLGSSGELRVDNARKLFADLDEGKAVRIGYVRGGKAATASVTPMLDQEIVWVGGPDRTFPRVQRIDVPGIAPDVREEVIRIRTPRNDCVGKDCKFPALAQAFRWNGLNLASVDAKLGRYFGTDRGVLVLTSGPDLATLQPGDVIQKIDGRAVNSPREAMDALRGKADDAMALVEYLRDRRVASTRIKAPKLEFDFIPPPAPPAPPAVRAPKAPKAPLPPPPPPAPPAVGAAGVESVFIGDDLQVFAIETAPAIELEIETRE